MNLGKTILALRRRKNMSQGKLAAEAGCDASFISLIESGQRDPSLSFLLRVASAFRLPPAALLLLAADPEEAATYHHALQVARDVYQGREEDGDA